MSVFAFRYVYDDANAAKMDELRPLHRGYLGEGAKHDIVLDRSCREWKSVLGAFTDC